ncbi:hypothetical protein [Aurantimonas marina]|uniref:hypothetical protein n=1 Tax=Aurantimonas marina TaxID=2780508 RepID=UPI0019D1F7B5|nr:hypothetical protein [Aurantimonas marina]
MKGHKTVGLALSVRAVIVAAAVAASPARAQNWTSSDRTAGFTVGGAYTGLFFRCGPDGKVVMIFSGFPGGLQDGGGYTVGVSVDGTVFLYEATARDGEAEGTSILVSRGSPAALSALIDALRKGRSAEISGPAGRYTIPLTDSGKALDNLRRTCG